MAERREKRIPRNAIVTFSAGGSVVSKSGVSFKDPSNITFDEALAYIAEATDNYHKRDIDAIVSAYADDIRIRYASFPVMNGPAEAREWLNKRFGRQKNYRLDKRAVNVMNNIIGASWEGWWDDAATGKAMQCQACEFVTINPEGKIKDWYVAMSVWEANGEMTTPLT